MKSLILIVIFCTISCRVSADCADIGISVWPYSTTLKKNPIILLSAFFGGVKNDILLGLNKKYPVYLKSAHQVVPLNVIEICTGRLLLQVLLKPNRELDAGFEYELCIDSMPSSIKELLIHKWNFQKQRIDPTPKWKVIDEKDETAPAWLSKPKEVDKIYWRGCPSRTLVRFSCDFSDNSQVLVKLAVKNLTSGKTYTYYSEPSLGIVNIGDFACKPEFLFEKQVDYEVQFKLMDASGNSTKDIENTIQFFSPIPPSYQ